MKDMTNMHRKKLDIICEHWNANRATFAENVNTELYNCEI